MEKHSHKSHTLVCAYEGVEKDDDCSLSILNYLFIIIIVVLMLKDECIERIIIMILAHVIDKFSINFIVFLSHTNSFKNQIK